MSYQRSRCGVFWATLTTALLVVFSTTFGQENESADDLAKQTSPPETSFDLREFTANPNAEEAHSNNVVVYGEWDGPPLTNGIPLGFKVIEGDIVVPEEFGEGGAATTFGTGVWANGVIPFEFDPNVSEPNAAAMLDAMSWWENVAAVDFRPRNGEEWFIHIQNNAFNNSPVGPRLGGIINIVDWDNTAIMAHELGHTLGFWHEQSRADRGAYVTINTMNVCQTCCPQSDGSMGPCDFNFRIEDDSLNYGPYDFDSVMHYGRCDFTVNSAVCTASCPSGAGETVTVNAPFNATWQCGEPSIDPVADSLYIGQRTHLSYWDSLVMSFLYPRANWRFQSPSGFDSPLGSFLVPFRTFATGYVETPVGGTLWILYPTTLAVGPVLNKPMTIGAPLGGVVLTR